MEAPADTMELCFSWRSTRGNFVSN